MTNTYLTNNTYLIHYREPTSYGILHDCNVVKTVTVTAGTLQLAIKQFELKFHDSIIIGVEQQERE
jgi:hypothetical protein